MSQIIDTTYLQETLLHLLSINSPTGYTDEIVHTVATELTRLGIDYTLTRRGAIRAVLPGKDRQPDRALVTHLDTLGAMVTRLKDNGRLAITQIGTWSPRFAEGARVTVYTDDTFYRGTIMPLKASGHTYNDEIDNQPVSWDNLEIRLDAEVFTATDLTNLGLHVGDFIAVDTQPEVVNGYINARHLDNKAGVASKLAAAKALLESPEPRPVDVHLLFTITEEEGTGASSILQGDAASMIAIDNSTVAPGQNSREDSVVLAMRDQGGIYDYHLNRKLIDLCRTHDIPHVRDVFRHYKSDATAALSAGNDVRTALVCFGLDASHGYERTHIKSLAALAALLYQYAISPVDFPRDAKPLSPLEGFPEVAEEHS